MIPGETGYHIVAGLIIYVIARYFVACFKNETLVTEALLFQSNNMWLCFILNWPVM
jgi:hypothetical protein